jgi:small-conductance mechanosensitive channel
VTSPATILALLTAPTPAPTPSADCKQDLVCKTVYDVTDSVWLAEGSFYFLVKPFRVIVIFLIAMVIRFILHRLIDRLVRSTSGGSVPSILKPLREKAPTGSSDPAAMMPERRRQRAEAIGSVLRSSVTAFVFSIATLMALREFNFDLAPLLASAGIAGLALGFGAQSLVKDLLSGLFMLLEDQYGVGDNVDLGEASGVVEAVGLRITTVQDARGVRWYVRNGEILRVGNKSQGWATVMIDMPIGFARTEEATAVLRDAAAVAAADPDLAEHFIEPPEVLGVEQVTVDGAVIRTIAKTTADGQYVAGRELRRRLTEALEEHGVTAKIAATRMFPRPATPAPGTPDSGPGGPT